MTTPFPVAEPLTLTRAVALLLMLGVGVLAVVAQALATFAGFNIWFMAAALVCYGGACGLILLHVGRHHPFANFGPANVVTWVRLVLTCLSAGLIAETARPDMVFAPDAAWVFTAIAVLTLLLDGLDGVLARRSGQISPFGARFDMEVDALQILLLSVAAATLGKAGAWIILAGLMRYIYIACGWLWPQLTQPLPPSMRRKAVCALQIAVLIVLLAPPIVPPFSAVLGFVALVALITSFALDVVWALRKPALQPAT